MSHFMLCINLVVCMVSEIIIPAKSKVKVKFTLEQATKAQTGSRNIALLFLNLGAGWGWVVNATPWPLYPPGKVRYPLYRRLCGPQGQSGWMRKISPSPALPLGKTWYPLYRRLGGPPGASLDGCGKSQPHRDSIPAL